MSRTLTGEHTQNIWLTDTELVIVQVALRYYLAAQASACTAEMVASMRTLVQRLEDN